MYQAGIRDRGTQVAGSTWMTSLGRGGRERTLAAAVAVAEGPGGKWDFGWGGGAGGKRTSAAVVAARQRKN